MFKLIFKRILEAIPTMFIIVTFSFFLMRLAPGSPFTTDKNITPQVMANLKAKYGMDEPLWMQYFEYLKQVLHGDFGPSFKYKDFTVNELLAQAFPPSIELGFYSLIIALTLGITIGIIAALRQNTWIDYSVMSFAMVGVVVPSFVKAPLMILLFAVTLGWLPAGGWNDGAWQNLVLPVAALSIGSFAALARVMRGSMIETLNSPFIRTARSKGIPTHRIIIQHALRPAMLPVVTFISWMVVSLITGSLIIEQIFGLPGIGQLFVNGAMNRDYSIVMSLTIIISFATIVTNALADIMYGVVDPKIRY